MNGAKRRFSTGLRFLDRKLDGGIEAGGLVALTASPSSQSELLLRQLMAANKTLFISTTRPEEELLEWGKAIGTLDWTARRVAPERLVDDVEAVIAELPPESLLIIDPIDLVEDTPRSAYLTFLDRLKERLRVTDSIGVLHCIAQERPSKRRRLTLKRADHVWELQVLVLSREIKSRLIITKSRNGRALTEPVEILLTDQVRIDTSRQIG